MINVDREYYGTSILQRGLWELTPNWKDHHFEKRTLYKGIDRLAIVLTKECNLKLFRKSFCSRHYMGCFINPIEIFWLHLYSITWGYAINVLYNATSVWAMPKGVGWCSKNISPRVELYDAVLSIVKIDW